MIKKSKLSSYKLRKEELSKIRKYTNRKVLNKASKYLKEQREKKNLSRYSLSNKTKISVTVIEALENGWTYKFPENAYLHKMLRRLEKELSLDTNSLNGLLPSESKKRQKKGLVYSLLEGNKIYSGALSFIIYIISLFISILLLNKYYLFLSESNVITVSPLLPRSDSSLDLNGKLKDNKKN